MIWNPDAETLEPGARARLQLARIATTLDWARTRVPFHRERLAGARIDALEDLRMLPLARSEGKAVRVIERRSSDMLTSGTPISNDRSQP